MRFDEIVNKRLTALLVWLSIAMGATYLFIFDPGKTGFFPACPFRTLTGFTCPGCGSTRGLHRLLHGDIVSALEFYSLIVLSLPFLLYALVRYTAAAVSGRRVQKHYVDAKYIWMLCAVIMSFWIFRNPRFYT